MPSFNSLSGALRYVIENGIQDICDKSSTEAWAIVAAKYFSSSFMKKHGLSKNDYLCPKLCGSVSTTASIIRKEYRKKYKIKGDNRTYEGQPRRNMLDDNSMDFLKYQRVLCTMQTLIAQGNSKEIAILFDCHSIEQQKNLYNEAMTSMKTNRVKFKTV